MARPALYGENMLRITLHLPQHVIDQLADEGRRQQRSMADVARLMLQNAMQQARVEDFKNVEKYHPKAVGVRQSMT
jgi:hypothetical protein